MSSALTQLSDRSLQRLKEALASNRLTTPVSSLTLAQLIPQEQLQPILNELRELQHAGMTPAVLIRLIDMHLWFCCVSRQGYLCGARKSDVHWVGGTVRSHRPFAPSVPRV